MKNLMLLILSVLVLILSGFGIKSLLFSDENTEINSHNQDYNHSNTQAKAKSSRIKYMTKACHNSTATFVKTVLREEGQTEDNFCGCVANQTIEKTSYEDAHTFALAYHEANIVIEQSKARTLSKIEIGKGFDERAKNYNLDHGISYQRLKDLTEPALNIIMYWQANI